MAGMSDLWLPEGLHWDLHIEHKELPNAGPFTGGGHKLCLHTTESPREAVDSMFNVLRVKNAAPHVVIGYRAGVKLPVVIQMVPFDCGGRSLAHPSGPQTNRANAIQIEICGRAAESQDWGTEWYQALANLGNLIDHRFEFPFNAPRAFPGTRYTGNGWVNAKGIVGHCHCPGNDHVDPGKFRSSLFVKYLKEGKQQIEPR